MTSLIDIHDHLQEEIIAPHAAALVERAVRANVVAMLCNGTTESDWTDVATLAQRYEPVLASYGLHPWFAEQRSDEWLTVLQTFLQAMPSAVGEVGLDRLRCKVGERDQEIVLRAQLQLAKDLARPVTVHCLRAWGALLGVLKGVGPFPAGLLLHSYSGAAELIPTLAGLGACFSFSGAVLWESRRKAHVALKQVPLDRLLLETDAPTLLPPEPYRRHLVIGVEGSVCNEPANLPLIVEGVARILGLPAEKLADQTTSNARRFLEPIWP